MKLVINTCYGGFGLSDKAYEKLIEWGVPVKKYEEQERDPKTGLYDNSNTDRVIYDRKLTPKGEDSLNDLCVDNDFKFMGRYWEIWTREERDNELLIKVVEELGEEANGRCADLEIVEIPDGIIYHIEDYDGIETIHEEHRSWS